jgi:anti-sigma28 factor (negative regulator of flagellin synthesis)
MKIEFNNLNLKKLITHGKNEKKVSENKGAQETKEADTEIVNFSEDLKKAEEKVVDVLNYPDKRAEKLNKIKNMIKSGKYNVDVHKVTEKVIEDLLYGKFYQ